MAKRTNDRSVKSKQRSQKQQPMQQNDVETEVATLEQRIREETPARGFAPPLNQVVSFRSLPLSDATLRGLEAASYTQMTAIQNACIPHALTGRDIMGAARTGSGKTLAFCIPILECLFRKRMRPADGPGAVVLSPTRELAVQIFEVLRKVGAYHALSAGLLVGGKKEFWVEQRHVGTTNILIATPGRLLQHLEQTPDLDMSFLQMLVLDEADRILDMGFRDQLLRILDYLPAAEGDSPHRRQTLLFSATQTRKVSDLATLSLHKPEYLGVHDQEATATPKSLQQSYVVVPLQHKWDALYSFMKSHLKTKSIVFLASCNQVRYAWELFCSMQPGIPILALHGKLVQEKRTKIYFDFCQRPHAVLLATDVAARGLDFPNVDWVVQLDAPEDQDMYIHRVGRTARYKAGGKSLLVVTPDEDRRGIISLLQGANQKIPIKKVSINPNKTVVVSQKAANMVASNPKLNTLAKKAFTSYVRSVDLMPQGEIFQVDDLPLSDFATSLGLQSAPNLQFLKKAKTRVELRETKNVNHKLNKLKQQIKAEKLAKKLQRLGEAGATSSGDQNDGTNVQGEDQDDDDVDLLLVKNRHDWKVTSEDEDLPDSGVHEVTLSRKAKRIRIDGPTSIANKHIVFDEDGEEQTDEAKIWKPSVVNNSDSKNESLEIANENYLSRIRERLQSNLEKDRTQQQERIREKHKKLRLREKAEKSETVDAVNVMLGESIADQFDNCSNDATSSDNDGDSSESSSESDDVEEQERQALSLIRNIS